MTAPAEPLTLGSDLPNKHKSGYAAGLACCLRIVHAQCDAHHDKKKLVFRNQAVEIATFVSAGGIDKIVAVDGLAEAADTIGLDTDIATAIIADAFTPKPPLPERDLEDSGSKPEFPSGYRMTERGLVWSDPSDTDKPEQWLAGPFEVLAETRDSDGKYWGVLLEWQDHDGRQHRLALARSTLAGDGADARRALLDGGLSVARPWCPGSADGLPHSCPVAEPNDGNVSHRLAR